MTISSDSLYLQVETNENRKLNLKCLERELTFLRIESFWEPWSWRELDKIEWRKQREEGGTYKTYIGWEWKKKKNCKKSPKTNLVIVNDLL